MTFDEARLMANVNDRAQPAVRGRLPRPLDGARNRLEIRSGQGATYLVDTGTGACDCPFYRAHQGRHPCKHALGWRLLLSQQRACRRLLSLLLLRAWADLDDAAPARAPEGRRHG